MNTDIENIEGLEFINSEEKPYPKKETIWSVEIKLLAKIIVGINAIAGIILCIVFAKDYTLEDYCLVPIVVAILNCVIYYPLIVGFSIIVAAAEKKLKE